MGRVISSILASVALLVACSELRSADSAAPPTPTSPLAEAGTSSGTSSGISGNDAVDAALRDDDAGPTMPREPTCDAGSCPVEALATDLGNLGAFAIDDLNVYVSKESGAAGGGIFQCSKVGCGAFSITLASTTTPWLGAGGSQVIWTDASFLRSCDRGGCNAAPKAVLQESSSVGPLLVTSDRLVWRVAGTTLDKIRICPLASCGSSNASTITSSKGITSLAASGSVVVWADGEQTIRTCSAKLLGICGAPIILGKGLGEVSVSYAQAFWVTGKTIVRANLDGKDLPHLVAQSAEPRKLVSDENHVYWRDATEDHLYRCPRAGCAQPETVATDIAGGTDAMLLLDGDYIYWTSKKGVFRRKK